jgi:P4 family phage/plasmid primase-like protien
MLPLRKFLSENFLTEDGLIAFTNCWRNKEYTFRPSNKLEIDDTNMTELSNWASRIMNGFIGDGLTIWLKNIPNLYVIDVDCIVGLLDENKPLESSIVWDEFQSYIKEHLPFLKNQPYTLSRNKKLPHYFLKIKNVPKYKNKVDIIKPFKLGKIERIKADILCDITVEQSKGYIYNYNNPSTLDWNEISQYFDIAKMKIVEFKSEVKNITKKNKQKIYTIDENFVTKERKIRDIIQRYFTFFNNQNKLIFSDYNEWLEFGFMIIHELGENGWNLYDEFCSKCQGYNQEKNREWFYKNLDKEVKNPITIATYIHRLKQYGIYMDDIISKSKIFSHQDVAELYANLYAKQNIKYISEDDICFIYNEQQKLWIKHTGKTTTSFIMSSLKDTLQPILREAIMTIEDYTNEPRDKVEEKIENILKFLKKLGDSSFAKNIYFHLLPLITDNDFIKNINANDDFLPIKNGLKICLKTGEIEERVRTDFYTFECCVEIKPNCDFVNVYKYLNAIFIGKDQDNTKFIDYMQLRIGNFLTGNFVTRDAMILYGMGMNGKSTFINLLKLCLGDYLKTCSSDIIIKDGHRAKRSTQPEMFDLFNTRVALVNELDDEDEINSKNLKTITGGDELAVRGLFEKRYTNFKSKAKIIIPTNKLPKIDINDIAITDRLCLVPFNARFNDKNSSKEQTDFLNSDFVNEFFTWAVEGSIRSYDELDRFIEKPIEINEGTKEYFDQFDKLGLFIEENYENNELEYKENIKNFKKDGKKEGNKEQLITVKILCDEYKQYCLSRRVKFDKKQIEYRINDMFKIDEINRYKFIACLVRKKDNSKGEN